MTEKNWRLPRRAEKLYRQWSETAADFLDRWGFKPRLAEDGAVKLFIQSPVSSIKISLETGNATEWTLKTRYHAAGDVEALMKWYQSLRTKKKKPRRHLDVAELKIDARRFHAAGKSLREIAKKLFPVEYRAAIDYPTRLQSLMRRVRRYL